MTDKYKKSQPRIISFTKYLCVLLFVSLLFDLSPLYAAGAGSLPGNELSLWWGLPFLGMLGSLAFFPLFAIHFWENHYGKISLGWALVILLAISIHFGITETKLELVGIMIDHYLPFIIILGALYTISGGIRIDVKAEATPLINTSLLTIGTLLAGWIGTTGASMVMIRPLLHVNRERHYKKHLIIFFIFLVSNIGGALTPLGDPPLFLGFLSGVSFFWTLEYLTPEMVMMAIPLLFIFYFLDRHYVLKEGMPHKTTRPEFSIEGWFNGFLFLGVMGLVILSGLWKPEITFDLPGATLELQELVRDVGLVLLAMASWFLTPEYIHKANHYSWEPLKEVAKLFFGIFVTVIPVIAILSAGTQGALAPLISLVTVDGVPQNAMYFWLTGSLSAFLDNAPTYIVFFHTAGGDPEILMTTLARTLEAISLGAVFMGAMTYIGNAPNFMVKTIAESQRIQMPSFFGYMLWSVGFLLPLFIVLSLWQFS